MYVTESYSRVPICTEFLLQNCGNTTRTVSTSTVRDILLVVVGAQFGYMGSVRGRISTCEPEQLHCTPTVLKATAMSPSYVEFLLE